MVNIVALRLRGLLPQLKLIDLFVKVGLCADVRAFAQTTQLKSGLSRLPPRLECVTSRPRYEAIEHDLHPVDYRLLKPDPGCSNRSSSASATWVCPVSTDWLLLS